MRVKTKCTLKCDDHMIVADTIMDDSKMEIPEFILELVEKKSDLVEVLNTPVLLVTSAVKEEGSEDGDDGSEEGSEEDNDDGSEEGSEEDNDESNPSIKRRGRRG